MVALQMVCGRLLMAHEAHTLWCNSSVRGKRSENAPLDPFISQPVRLEKKPASGHPGHNRGPDLQERVVCLCHIVEAAKGHVTE
jgi:hypothetical protein